MGPGSIVGAHLQSWSTYKHYTFHPSWSDLKKIPYHSVYMRSRELRELEILNCTLFRCTFPTSRAGYHFRAFNVTEGFIYFFDININSKLIDGLITKKSICPWQFCVFLTWDCLLNIESHLHLVFPDHRSHLAPQECILLCSASKSPGSHGQRKELLDSSP